MREKSNELIHGVLEDLLILIKESTAIANDFQAGNTGSANQKLIVYLDKFTMLIQGIKELNKNDELVVGGGDVNKISDVLLEMEKAMSSQDYVLLADLLEYEIKEVLEGIHKGLAEQ